MKTSCVFFNKEDVDIVFLIRRCLKNLNDVAVFAVISKSYEIFLRETHDFI